MNKDEESADNILDENGEAFFQPIDWATMARKAYDDQAKLNAMTKEHRGS